MAGRRGLRACRLAGSAAAPRVALGLQQQAKVVDGGQRARVAVAEVSAACSASRTAPPRLEVALPSADCPVVDGGRCVRMAVAGGLTVRLQHLANGAAALESPSPAAARPPG